MTGSRPRSASRLSGPVCLLACLLLFGCSGQVPVRPPVESRSPLIGQAEQRLAEGAPLAAAALFQQAAEELQGEARSRLLLRAAEAYRQAARPAEALALLETLDGTRLTAPRQLEAGLLRAAAELDLNRPQQALDSLAILQDRLPPETEVAFHRLRARAYDQLGNPLEAARERVWLDALLDDPEQRRANHRLIWQSLNRLSDTALIQLRGMPPDVLAGWMERVLLERSLPAGSEQRQQALAAWQQRYPGHPALEETTVELLASPEAGPAPRHLGVLLPLSGELAGAAAAIRDGLLAAHYDARRDGETLQFYDTAGDPQRVWGLYRQAIEDGAEFVIGPLAKEAVAELARTGELEVPVLALNRIPLQDNLPQGLYQFALAPEDEARQVAERAAADGRQRALALVPEGAWGDRVLHAFLEHWEALGGQLLEVQHYSQDRKALSGQVRELLNLDASERRRQQLSRLLGQRLEFEPRRRRDADFVFVLARPATARLLRPLLRFHHAAELPVYATSHPFSGNLDPERDRDMNGLRFCDMPWVLEPQASRPHLDQLITSLWPERLRHYRRLFAFGIDAHDVLPQLQQTAVGQTFEGLSGRLWLDARGRLHRQLLWAEFADGRPRRLEAVYPLPPLSPATATTLDDHVKDDRHDLEPGQEQPQPSAGPLR
ncbi:penicillin-binding protein activator [Thiohalobacter sp. IOR34]|uniref:penicillin-binding protein activator n=1 Tax=Thiohalobacter sp. IOR34 TaxID=3057176 RepID=UPI0025B03D07|nr:penicillin-binding protein activator [Thiohalobacter sp. IOR34]WJW74830.1 penicillin-binding protein activator [Thiohalobacter sp. IOR34]